MKVRSSPEIDTHKCSQLTFDKGAKVIQGKKDSLFNKWCWDKWTSMCKKVNSDIDLILFAKINSKWTKDPKVDYKTLKLLGDNTGENLGSLRFGYDILDMPEA